MNAKTVACTTAHPTTLLIVCRTLVLSSLAMGQEATRGVPGSFEPSAAIDGGGIAGPGRMSSAGGSGFRLHTALRPSGIGPFGHGPATNCQSCPLPGPRKRRQDLCASVQMIQANSPRSAVVDVNGDKCHPWAWLHLSEQMEGATRAVVDSSYLRYFGPQSDTEPAINCRGHSMTRSRTIAAQRDCQGREIDRSIYEWERNIPPTSPIVLVDIALRPSALQAADLLSISGVADVSQMALIVIFDVEFARLGDSWEIVRAGSIAGQFGEQSLAGDKALPEDC